jgi:predicted dehydrogenase
MRFAPLLVMLEEDGRPVDCTPAQGADTDWDASVRRGVESVVAAVRDGVAPLVRPDEMLVVQETIDALYRSATTRREVLVR